MPDATFLTRIDWTVWTIGVCTGAATLFGGVVALRLRASAGLLFAVASGAVLGVVLFDLLPEALRLGAGSVSVFQVLTATACGFVVYLLGHRLAVSSDRGLGLKAHLGAGALTLHSLIDGLGIGLAFKASAAVGAGVAFAVLAHDCLDGANTVTLSLSGGAGRPDGAAMAGRRRPGAPGRNRAVAADFGSAGRARAAARRFRGVLPLHRRQRAAASGHGAAAKGLDQLRYGGGAHGALYGGAARGGLRCAHEPPRAIARRRPMLVGALKGRPSHD